MERWVGSLRREILDRILIANTAHLRMVLAEHEAHFNTHRPHRSMEQASPLRALPEPTGADTKVIRHDRLGGLLHEYSQVAWGGRVSGTHTWLATGLVCRAGDVSGGGVGGVAWRARGSTRTSVGVPGSAVFAAGILCVIAGIVVG
jgi:hypothetical protein